jgi:outer membrane biosynthesis protein TonB
MPSMMRPALAASLVALSLALAGCGQPQPTPAEAPTAGADASLSQEPIDAVPITAEPTPAPAPAAPPKPKTEPVVSKPAEPVGEPGSCLAEIGEARSKRLVERCIQVSPATRPPCNSANPCAMIQGEIDRSCAMYGPDEVKPKECAA